jgi:cytochrome c oxidase cbb3-type subunit III
MNRFSIGRSRKSKGDLMSFPGPVIAVAVFAIAASAQPARGQAQGQAPSEAELRDQAYNPGPPPDPAAVERGQKIFLPTCAGCHGAGATGGTGPNLLDVPVVLKDENGNTLAPFLHDGRPAQGMPAFPSLTAAQVADISAFLHARERIAADRFNQEFPEIVTGDPKAGKVYFEGPGKCSTCHSPTGDLANVAKTYKPAMLMSRICYPGAKTYRAMPPGTMVTVTLPSGKVVSGPLVHRDEYYVELTVADGSLQIYPVTGAKVEVKDPLAAHVELSRHYTDANLHDLVAYLETFK